MDDAGETATPTDPPTAGRQDRAAAAPSPAGAPTAPVLSPVEVWRAAVASQAGGAGPGATLPHATLPHATVPHATVPHATVPHATVPHATVPQATTPHGAPLPGAPGRPPTPLPPTPLSLAQDAFWAARTVPAPAVTLAACAAVGVLGGALLVTDRPGLGGALVGLAVWGAAVPTLLRRRAWQQLVTAALAVALVAMVAFRDAGWVVALCVTVAAVAGAVAATSAVSTPAVVFSPLTWAFAALRALPWVRHGVGALMGARRAQMLVALRSVAVTVVLLVVFGALFASADSVFASYLPRLDIGILPAQVLVGALVALLTASLAHLAIAPPGWSDHRMAERRPARRGEWLLPVGALAALVLAFVLVQVGALVDGHAHVLDTLGLSYAEYARQGFAQLVAVTALTLVVVGVAARRAPRATARDRLVSRVALGVLCVGSLGVVASALRRMDLYVEAFGLTRLRLLVLVAEVALATVLVLVMVAGVRWRGAWLPVAVVQVVAVAMLGLALADPDAQIVRHNTTNEARERLDLDYLRGLSADAVPALDALDEPLRSCALRGRQVPAAEGVGDLNLGRWSAARVLEDVTVDDGATCTQWSGGPRP